VPIFRGVQADFVSSDRDFWQTRSGGLRGILHSGSLSFNTGITQMKMHFRIAFIGLLASVFTLVAAQDGPEFVTEVEGIGEYRLDNGMKVLLMPDSSRPTTTVNVTYFVGSKHESYGETGMAHLLEHLVFMGTPDHTDIKKEISERGGFANGTTWWERTNYFQTLPSEVENLEWSLRMEADRMVNSFISAEDLESEMTVVRNEFEIGENNPFRVLLQRVMATAYEWHGYGRSTIEIGRASCRERV